MDSVLDNAVAEMTALYNWANLICRELPERAERHGPMSAREVHVAMDAGFKELSEDDIGRLLAMLSHPLIGVVHRVEGGGGAEPRYAPASNCSATVWRRDPIDANGAASEARQAQLPPFSEIASSTFGGDMGSSVIRMPRARLTAFPTAAKGATMGVSPQPRTP